MKHTSATAEQQALLAEVRSMLAPANPVAPTAFQGGEQDWIRPMRAERMRTSGRWRLLAPALSGLAVIGVVTGVTLAGGAAPSRPLAGPAAPPRFYVTINGIPSKQNAQVRSTATGAVLSSVPISSASGDPFASIAATRSDRVFYITQSIRQPKTSAFTIGLSRLTLSANGRTAKLIRLPVFLNDPKFPGEALTILGLAVSPDGRHLAATALAEGTPGPSPHLTPVSEVIVIPTRASGGETIWRSPGDFAYDSDPVWMNNRDLAFVWEDHFKGSQYDYTARTTVRLLDTRTSNRNLLKAPVLVAGNGKLGVIEAAYAPPGGGPVIAALARDTPPTGPKGTVLVRLAALSRTTGKITKVFARHVLNYRNENQRFRDNGYYGVEGFDASGKFALVRAPHFGMIGPAGFTQLPTPPGIFIGAAW